MREEKLSRMYSEMSSPEQRQYGRWLSANVVIASLFGAGLLAIALMGRSGWKYEAAIKPNVMTAGNSQPDISITGSIGPAKAHAAEQ
jgi:hypothetical protein